MQNVPYLLWLSTWHLACLWPNGPGPNTPLHATASPISLTCCLCFSHGKGFVSTSVVCCWVLTLSMVITPSHTCSFTEWNCVPICFAHLWNWGFLNMAINLSLSLKIVVSNVCANPSSLNRLLNQHASHVTLDKVIYSASMVDNAVTDCLLKCWTHRVHVHMPVFAHVRSCFSWSLGLSLLIISLALDLHTWQFITFIRSYLSALYITLLW